MASKGPRKSDGGFDLSQTPSHLLRRCVQYANDLFSREPGASELTKQQFTVLFAVEQNDGVSQTDLVGITGIDRSTLAEMIQRMTERGHLARERTETDARANAVRITPSGRKALRGARAANERVEKALIAGIPVSERARLTRLLTLIVAHAETGRGAGSRPLHKRRGQRRGR
jgi:DNA-binding MarR family transcriptional regulator